MGNREIKISSARSYCDTDSEVLRASMSKEDRYRGEVGRIGSSVLRVTAEIPNSLSKSIDAPPDDIADKNAEILGWLRGGWGIILLGGIHY